jgi:hypothetical protein
MTIRVEVNKNMTVELGQGGAPLGCFPLWGREGGSPTNIAKKNWQVWENEDFP